MPNREKRQTGIIKAGELTFPIHILGAGGIGSWTALLLAKMGCSNIIVYDNDKVEDHNVSSQFFKESQLGMNKVDALYDSILEQSGIEIEKETNIKMEEYIKNELVIIAIDSMEERIRIGEIYKDKNNYIIDGRMGGLSFEVYNCESDKYLETTVPPLEVETDACTAKAICFNCAVIGGTIANHVRMKAKDSIQPGEVIYCFNTQTLLKKYYEY